MGQLTQNDAAHSRGVADSYDFENHLTNYGLVNLVYDADGNRVSETIGGTTTGYVVDSVNPTGYPQVLEEIVNGAVQRKYTWGHWLLSENQFNSGTWTKNFYLYDGHGSVRNLADASGNITDSYTYDAFGNLIESSGSTPNNYLFAGEQFDPVLNLYYNRARYLNTNTGRFWSMDTEEGNGYEPFSLHKYLYANSDPVGYFDRDGHLAEEEAFAAGEEASIGADEDYTAIQIFHTLFRTTVYAGDELVYSQPSLFLQAAAALTASAVTADSIYEALNSSPDLPDVAASKQGQDDLYPIVLWRDINGTNRGEFKWRGPVTDPDGLSLFESPFSSPIPKKFSVGFRARYFGTKRDGALGGFVEPELLNIPIIYSPNLGGEGHWSVPVTTETATQYQDKFSQAAKRIKAEDPSRFLQNSQ